MEKPQLYIRSARRKDRKEMKDCNERNLKENYTAEYWEQILLGHPKYSYVLVINGNASGNANSNANSNASGNASGNEGYVKGYILCDGTTILSFAIDEPYRNQGYGTQLIQKVIEYHSITGQDKLNAIALNLHVRKSNNNAIKLYLKSGFTIYTEIKDYYRNPNEDAYHMIKK